MKYYKDKDGAVFAYETDADREKFGPDDLVEMTESEISAHLNPPVSDDQVIYQYKAEIQQHMDAEAQALGYDDIATAVTYAEEPAVPKFQAEGQAFRAWRSQVWAYGYALIDAVMAGERERPDLQSLLSELPALEINYPAE